MIDVYTSCSSIEEHREKLALEIFSFSEEETELYDTNTFQRYLHFLLSSLESECEELGINVKDISFIEIVLILTCLNIILLPKEVKDIKIFVVSGFVYGMFCDKKRSDFKRRLHLFKYSSILISYLITTN